MLNFITYALKGNIVNSYLDTLKAVSLVPLKLAIERGKLVSYKKGRNISPPIHLKRDIFEEHVHKLLVGLRSLNDLGSDIYENPVCAAKVIGYCNDIIEILFLSGQPEYVEFANIISTSLTLEGERKRNSIIDITDIQEVDVEDELERLAGIQLRFAPSSNKDKQKDELDQKIVLVDDRSILGEKLTKFALGSNRFFYWFYEGCITIMAFRLGEV